MVNLTPADVQDAAGAEAILTAIRMRWPWLEHLFADDRSDPLFSSHLTMSQLKIMLLLSRHGTLAGGDDRI